MKRRRREFISGVATAAALFIGSAGVALAGKWDISGSVTGELRIFPYAPAFPEQRRAAVSPSVAAEPEIVYETDDRSDRLTLVPFGRWDAHDDNRTHADIREANWLRLGESWDLVVGIDRVFWGVTESRHLVDIVNQFDGVEDIDNEDKLGQPMVSLNLESDWGAFGFFVLPGFRARSFPDNEARLRGPLQIDDDDPTFDSGAERAHVDFALRWKHTLGDWDIGLSQFIGTSREPRLIPTIKSGNLLLVPHYDQIDQTGLDLQLTTKATLWKLEAIMRGGHGDRFAAVVGGLEHTFFGVLKTRADLGLLAEYLYDGRNPDTAPPTSAEDDFFVGTRLTLNDEQDTAFLAGAVIDRTSQATLLFVEAERRLGERWKLELEGRFFINVPDDDPIAAIRDDDFVKLRLSLFL
jgi:hypothetical protein